MTSHDTDRYETNVSPGIGQNITDFAEKHAVPYCNA